MTINCTFLCYHRQIERHILYDHILFIFNLTITNDEETYPEDDAVEGKSIIRYFQQSMAIECTLFRFNK